MCSLFSLNKQKLYIHTVISYGFMYNWCVQPSLIYWLEHFENNVLNTWTNTFSLLGAKFQGYNPTKVLNIKNYIFCVPHYDQILWVGKNDKFVWHAGVC